MSHPIADQKGGVFVLPSLPYAASALEPYVSERTLNFHHGKHHNAYVNKLNELIKGTEFFGQSLEQIIIKTHGKSDLAAIFNNAAQVWNHTFFWHSIKPNGGGKPQGKLLAKIEEDFGSFEAFAEQFKAAGVSQFGSGWAWLVLEGKKLKIVKTGNADLPLVHGQIALLTADVWEHAYYLDYQNKRPDYLTTFMDSLVNWQFAEVNLKSAS
jgi:Fe-Mn family superoxide dismutase